MTRRVLFLTSTFPRWEGDSTTPFILHLCQDLQALGWEPHVLAPHAPGAVTSEVLGGIAVSRFRYAVPDSAETVCYQGGALSNLAKRPGEKLKLPLLVAAQTASALALAMSGEYDLIHSHWILPQGFSGVFSARLANLPHIVTVHGSDLFALRGKLLRRFKQFALQAADRITANSSVTENGVRELIGDSRHLSRIPIGADVKPLSEAERAAAVTLRKKLLPDGKGRLASFVGRLVDQKGVRDFLEGIALALDRIPGLRAVIVGDGPEKSAFEEYAGSLGLAGRVDFVGWASSAEVRLYLGASDYFVGPSRTAEDGSVEAQGLTFSEALGVGVPVVASRVGGIVDLVRHEVTGLLVTERQPAEIADALVRFETDAELVTRVTSEGQSTVQGAYSRRGSAAAFARLYEELTTRRA